MAKPDGVIIDWAVSCFDKRRKNPLPVYTRFYVLDESRATDEDKQAILALIHQNDIPTPAPPPGLGNTVYTFSQGRTGCDRRVLKYRSLFRECTMDELQSMLDRAKARGGPVRLESVGLMGEYFEDENGKEITDIEMMDYVAGGGPVIIMGNPKSVTRLGPSGMRAQDKWSIETANTMAHFFQVVDHVATSEWYRSPVSVSYDQSERVLSSVFPTVESALGMLLLFRQLYSSDNKDDLFNRACGTYLRHVDHPGKEAWVRAEKKSFNLQLSGPPSLPNMGVNCTTRQLVDMFLYGAGLIHARGKDQTDQSRMKLTLRTCRREKLVMVFHWSLRSLFASALTVYPVLKQDFVHWMKDRGAAGPDLIDIAKLLGSTPFVPEDQGLGEYRSDEEAQQTHESGPSSGSEPIRHS
jgi:hypothetical protein